MSRHLTISQRKRQLQIRFRLSFAVLGMMAFIVLFLFIGNSVSKANDHRDAVKLFTNIEVQYGDTLTSISERFIDEHYTGTKEYIKEVVRMNHLENANDIYAGQYIMVPYYAYVD